MKYDIFGPQKAGAKRTLNAFILALFTILTRKSFEEITIQEICAEAEYPRATFYNYFDDKYDLLNYLWYRTTSEIRLEEYASLPSDRILPVYFTRLYTLLESLEGNIRLLLRHNSGDGYLMSSVKIYFDSQIRSIVENVTVSSYGDIPRDLIISHFSQTMYLLFEWRFVRQNPCSVGQAYLYLMSLLKNLPPESCDPLPEDLISCETVTLRF